MLAPPEPAPLSILNAAAAREWRPVRFGAEAAPEASNVTSRSPVPRPKRMRSVRRVYVLCGRPIEVRFAPPSLERYVEQRFGHSRDDAAVPIGTLTLIRTRNGFALETPDGTTRLPSETALIGAFVRCFVELSHPENSWRAVAHAAAVVCDGKAIVLPGPNGSGKSTLVVRLLSAGCQYLSDDCVPISRDGRVVPVPFALCLKSGSWPVAAPYLPRLAKASVVAGPGGRPCRFVPTVSFALGSVAPGLLVFPRYAPDIEVKLRPLDPIESLTRLIAGRAWLSREPDDLAATLRMLEQLPAYALDYADLDKAAAAVLQLAG